MKKMGVLLSASSTAEESTSVKASLESISTNWSPCGSTSRMNLARAMVMRSGRRQRSTRSFLKGIWSSFFQSSGSFWSSGTSSLYQSLKRVGASTFRFCPKLRNSSNSVRPVTQSQARVGSQSRVFSCPGYGTHLIRKSISATSQATSGSIFFIMSLKVMSVRKMSLCLSKSPLEIHW